MQNQNHTTQIPEKNTDQTKSFSSHKKSPNTSFLNTPRLIIFLVAFFAVSIYIYEDKDINLFPKYTNSHINTYTPIENQDRTGTIPTPTVTPKLFWNITNADGFKFNYPPNYQREIRTNSLAGTKIILLNRENLEFGKPGSLDYIQKGARIIFTTYDSKDISEAALLTQFGNTATVKSILIDGREATEVYYDNIQLIPDIYIYVPLGNKVLEIATEIARIPLETEENTRIYQSEFIQTIETIKFTN